MHCKVVEESHDVQMEDEYLLNSPMKNVQILNT